MTPTLRDFCFYALGCFFGPIVSGALEITGLFKFIGL